MLMMMFVRVILFNHVLDIVVVVVVDVVAADGGRLGI